MAQSTAGPALFAAELMPKAPVERGLPEAMAELGQASGANALACLGELSPGPFVPREDTIQRGAGHAGAGEPDPLRCASSDGQTHSGRMERRALDPCVRKRPHTLTHPPAGDGGGDVGDSQARKAVQATRPSGQHGR